MHSKQKTCLQPPGKATYTPQKKETRQKEEARGWEKLWKAQLYQLGRESFVKLFCTVAHLPFLTTGQLLALSGVEADGLSLNRAQIYLRRAVEWGWFGFVNRYASGEAASELNPVATAGLTGLFHTSSRPLEAKTEAHYWESLTSRLEGLRSGSKTHYRTRHFYLTPQGAKVLTQLVQPYRKGQRVECNFDSPTSTSQEWRREFVRLFAFEEDEILRAVSRLAGLNLARQLLLALLESHPRTEDAPNFTTSNKEFGWWESSIRPAKLSIDRGGQANNGEAAQLLHYYFDAVLSNSAKYWLILADTENLSPSWLTSYWKEVCTHLHTLSPVAFAADLSRYSNWVGEWAKSNIRDVSQLLSDLAEFTQPRFNTQKLSAEASKPHSPTDQAAPKSGLKVLVLTRSQSRAILWRETIIRSQTSLGLEIEEALVTSNTNFEAEVVTIDDLADKGIELVQAFAKSEAAPYSTSSCKRGPEQFQIKPAMAYYLREAASPSTVAPAISARYFTLEKILPIHMTSTFLPSPPPLPNLKFERSGLLELLEQPSKRRLLFILHAYGPLDGLACSRLTGLEMTHLELHLKELQKAGLIARVWGNDARRGRTWGREWTQPNYGVRWKKSESEKENEKEKKKDDDESYANNDNKGQTKFTFCSWPPFEREEENRVDLVASHSGNDSRFYQDYGELSHCLRSTARYFPYATEAHRLERYYYFLTGKGLLALVWLEGFSLTFESRFRGELTRLSRIQSEVEAGERQLILTPDFEGNSAETGRFSWNEAGPDPAQIDLQHHSPQICEAVGFSWPSLLVEHFSGAANFFLAFPSRHFSQPFHTAPGIYPLPGKPGITKERERLFWEDAGFFKSAGHRQPLWGAGGKVSLESWQTEPLCHRYYMLPQRLARLGYDIPYSYIPNWAGLKLEAGGTRGECLPDGYAEVVVQQPGKEQQRAVIYLEFERGGRNWTPRYKAKITAYLGLFWSQWLLASIKLRQPLLSMGNVPVYVLFVASNASQEHKLRQLFRESLHTELSALLQQAHYRGYGPGGVRISETGDSSDSSNNEGEEWIVKALLESLGVQFLITHEGLLSWGGVLAPIWQSF